MSWSTAATKRWWCCRQYSGVTFKSHSVFVFYVIFIVGRIPGMVSTRRYLPSSWQGVNVTKVANREDSGWLLCAVFEKRRFCIKSTCSAGWYDSWRHVQQASKYICSSCCYCRKTCIFVCPVGRRDRIVRCCSLGEMTMEDSEILCEWEAAGGVVRLEELKKWGKASLEGVSMVRTTVSRTWVSKMPSPRGRTSKNPSRGAPLSICNFEIQKKCTTDNKKVTGRSNKSCTSDDLPR
jgi:hypothetical protein